MCSVAIFGSSHFGSSHFWLKAFRLRQQFNFVLGFELSAGVGVVLDEKFLFLLGSAVDSHLSGLDSRAL